MPNYWFTADHHFGHANIIKFCNRPFSYVDEMDEVLIQRWNDIVDPRDTVFHLGDFTLNDVSFFERIFRRLHGDVHIVPGGHDYRWVGRTLLLDTEEPLMSLEFADKKQKHPTVFVLCHYAMRVWDRSHYGSYHLYGHSHGTLPGLGRSMDVGVDTNNFYPYNLEEIVDRLSKIEPHNAPKH